MACTSRNCPVFSCGHTHLVRLANISSQPSTWLRWSKIEICIPRHNEEIKKLQESVKMLLNQQEEKERKFNAYLNAAKLKKGHYK